MLNRPTCELVYKQVYMCKWSGVLFMEHSLLSLFQLSALDPQPKSSNSSFKGIKGNNLNIINS